MPSSRNDLRGKLPGTDSQPGRISALQVAHFEVVWLAVAIAISSLAFSAFTLSALISS